MPYYEGWRKAKRAREDRSEWPDGFYDSNDDDEEMRYAEKEYPAAKRPASSVQIPMLTHQESAALFDGIKRRFPEYKDVAKAIEEYLRFMAIKKANITSKGLTPCEAVGHVWECHILSTEQYLAFSSRNFGGFLHHDPAGEDEFKDASSKSYAATYSAYESMFGKPEKPWWPTATSAGPAQSASAPAPSKPTLPASKSATTTAKSAAAPVPPCSLSTGPSKPSEGGMAHKCLKCSLVYAHEQYKGFCPGCKAGAAQQRPALGAALGMPQAPVGKGKGKGK